MEVFGLTSDSIDRGGKVVVFAGGTDLNGTLSKGSTEILSAGAFASATTISSGGAEFVFAGALAVGTTILSGGKLTIASAGADTVTSGGTANVVAVIGFIGHYVTSNFHITTAANGTVAIFDPPVIAQQSTLGFSDAPGGIAKIVGTVVGDTAAGKFALLGNYMASEFASVTNGHAGILPTEPQHTEQQPLLTHLHGR
jgi:autotransporter passenger strand-loop-strand repeat protein